MGKIGQETGLGFKLIRISVGIVGLLILVSGCSTASWVIYHNTTADDLIITEADVDLVINELSVIQPTAPYVVVYNEATDRYELTPDAYKKAIRDGIVRRIQDKKIREFLDDYRPETFADAFRKDVGTAGLVILILGILGGLFY